MDLHAAALKKSTEESISDAKEAHMPIEIGSDLQQLFAKDAANLLAITESDYVRASAEAWSIVNQYVRWQDREFTDVAAARLKCLLVELEECVACARVGAKASEVFSRPQTRDPMWQMFISQRVGNATAIWEKRECQISMFRAVMWRMVEGREWETVHPFSGKSLVQFAGTKPS